MGGLTPLQGGVLLDVLAVLVQGSGANALQLSTRQGGLQDVGRVDGALSRARTDQRVHLVNHLQILPAQEVGLHSHNVEHWPLRLATMSGTATHSRLCR